MKRFLVVLFILACLPLLAAGLGQFPGDVPLIGDSTAVGPRYMTNVASISVIPVPTPTPAASVPWNLDNDCVSFDGVDDIASAAAFGLPSGSEARTIMLWVYDDQTTSLGYMFEWGNVFGSGQVFAGRLEGTDTNSVRITYFGSQLYFSGFSRSVATWTHIAYTYPAGANITSTKAYANGSPLAVHIQGSDIPADTYAPATSTFSIGGNRYISGSYRLKCKVAELAIFNRELSQAEVQTYMPYRWTGSEPGLVRVYHCDEGSGSVLTDSISGKNATLLNGASWSTKL